MERPTGAGKTKAFVGTVRVGEEPLTCVVKLSCNLYAHPAECIYEWVASAVGRHLRLTTAMQVAVDFHPNAHGVATRRLVPEVAAHIFKSVSPAYGSVMFDPPARQLSRTDRLPPTMTTEASAVVAFDVLVHNDDRRAENHNLLVRRDAILLFDHDNAFGFRLAIPRGEPVTDPLLDLVRRHALFRAIGGRLSAPLLDFRERLALLTDADLQAIAASVPEEWTRGSGEAILGEVVDLLAARRDAVEKWLPQVEACLSRT